MKTLDALKFGCVLVLLLGAGLPVASDARADGGMISRDWADIWEPAQRALLQFDAQRGQEDLILQAEYEGRSDDLAWIVPVPSIPVLTEAEDDLFAECARMTAPLQRRRGVGCGLAEDGRIGAPGGIDVYSSQQVGIYQTLTIGASSAADLTDSLDAWGFLHAANRPSVEAALQFYIDKSWYFVAMRTDSATAAAEPGNGYHTRGLQPIRLSFATPRAVFPMRISAISARETSHVLLYVCAPHRMTFAGAHMEYANRINDRELASIRRLYPNLGAAVTQPCFFTKLRRYVPVVEMTDDLVLEPAPSDEEFREIHYSGIPLGEVVLLAMAGVFLGRSRRRRRE